MFHRTLPILLALLATVSTGDAFMAPTPRVARRVGLKMADANDEVAALRAAAAKAREDAERLSKELGKPMDSSSTATATAKPTSKRLSFEELLSRLTKIPFDFNGAATQTQELETLRQDGSLSLYKSANLRTYPVSLSMLESRTNLSLESFGFGNASGEIVTLDDFKYSTLYVLGGSAIMGVLSLALLPPNVGATACYLFALLPIAYIAIGSTAPAAIAQVIDSIKNRDDPERETLGDRVARHEAAHFMCGYMCGLKIVDYNIDERGVPCVEFSTGSERFSKEEIAALSVTAMSGLVAEGMEFGNVRGAQSDLEELNQIFGRAAEFIGSQQQQDLTRWGALQSFLLLKENKGKYDQIVEAFKDQKDVTACLAILES